MANPPLEGDSTNAAVAGVTGTNSANQFVQHAVGGTSSASQLISPENIPPPPPPPPEKGPLPVGVLGKATGSFGAGVVGSSVSGDGVQGSAQGNGNGVTGNSVGGTGVAGSSVNGQGVYAYTQNGSEAVYGEAVTGIGVHGYSPESGDAVVGEAAAGGIGVHGISRSQSGDAVAGEQQAELGNGNGGRFTANGTGSGVSGTSRLGTGGTFVAEGAADGVHGTTADANHSGVWGNNTGGGNGVSGSTADANHSGVWGNNTGGGNGVSGSSIGGNGVYGYSTGGYAVHGHNPGGFAGYFEGNCTTTGDSHIEGTLYVDNGDCHVKGTLYVVTDIVLIAAQDCAEEFDIAESELPDPGTVMVLDHNGRLASSASPYDKRVAGVISGAGEFRPGLILGRSQSASDRAPVALAGKVYCKVDASYAPIEIGDLLTTSPTPGHAMKADDPVAGFGAVIGKALKRLDSGKGLLPILVALQ